jgi:hypothetical protein
VPTASGQCALDVGESCDEGGNFDDDKDCCDTGIDWREGGGQAEADESLHAGANDVWPITTRLSGRSATTITIIRP